MVKKLQKKLTRQQLINIVKKGPIPNPQSPIPNPQSPIPKKLLYLI